MSKDSKIKKEIEKINEPSTPNSGVRVSADKINPAGVGERFTYRFSTNTRVRDAKPKKGATRSCADKQAENTVTRPTTFPAKQV